MFDHVHQNNIYNAVVQAGNNINFPIGSMELKAVWRILDPTIHDATRYHTARAIIYMPDSAQILFEDCLPNMVEKN